MTIATHLGLTIILDAPRKACPACGEVALCRLQCHKGGEPPYVEARVLMPLAGLAAAATALEIKHLQRALLDCAGRVAWPHGHGICTHCGETWLEQAERMNPKP